MTSTRMKLGFIGLGIMGAPMARPPAARPATSSSCARAARCPRSLARRHRVRQRQGGGASAPTSSSLMVPDTPDVEAVLFGEDGVAVGLEQGQDRGRHELDLADRDQGLRQEDQRARLRLPRRAGVRRRSRRQGRVSLTIMVGGPRSRLRARQAAVRADGQEHHAGRRQRRRPDHQGGQPDHRRAEHRRGGRSAGLRQQGRRRPGQGAPGADGRLRRPAASSKCTASA